MAFCKKCGKQVDDYAASCPSCGELRRSFPQPPYVVPTSSPSRTPPPSPAVASPETPGFISSLFDLSFTSFITTKLVKLLYALFIVFAAFGALVAVVAGFSEGVTVGMLVLVIAAPLLFFFSVIWSRVLLEIVIVVFRMAEHMAEIARRGRGIA